MTNIRRKTTNENVHLHIPEKTRFFLDSYLPKTYTKEVLNILEKDGIETSSGVIRNVRAGLSKNNKILKALVKFAEENKMLREEVESIIDNQ